MTKQEMIDYLVKLMNEADEKRVRAVFFCLTHALA